MNTRSGRQAAASQNTQELPRCTRDVDRILAELEQADADTLTGLSDRAMTEAGEQVRVLRQKHLREREEP